LFVNNHIKTGKYAGHGANSGAACRLEADLRARSGIGLLNGFEAGVMGETAFEGVGTRRCRLVSGHGPVITDMLLKPGTS